MTIVSTSSDGGNLGFWRNLWRAVPRLALIFLVAMVLAVLFLAIMMVFRSSWGLQSPSWEQVYDRTLLLISFLGGFCAISALMWSPSVVFFKDWGKYYFTSIVLVLAFATITLVFVQDWQFSLIGVGRWEVLGALAVTGAIFASLALLRLTWKAIKHTPSLKLKGLFVRGGVKLARVSAYILVILFVLVFLAFRESNTEHVIHLMVLMFGFATLAVLGMNVSGLKVDNGPLARWALLLFVVLITAIQLVLPESQYTGPVTVFLVILFGVMALVKPRSGTGGSGGTIPKSIWPMITKSLSRIIKFSLALCLGLLVGIATWFWLWQALLVVALIFILLLVTRVKGEITVGSLAPLMKSRSYLYSILVGLVVFATMSFFAIEVHGAFNLLLVIPGASYLVAMVAKNMSYKGKVAPDWLKLILGFAELVAITVFWVVTYAMTPNIFSLVILGFVWMFLVSVDMILPYLLDYPAVQGWVGKIRASKYFGVGVVVSLGVLVTGVVVGIITILIGSRGAIAPTLIGLVLAILLGWFFRSELVTQFKVAFADTKPTNVIYRLTMGKVNVIAIPDLARFGVTTKFQTGSFVMEISPRSDGGIVTITLDDLGSADVDNGIELRPPLHKTGGMFFVDFTRNPSGLLSLEVGDYQVDIEVSSFEVTPDKEGFTHLKLEVAVTAISS